MTSYSFADVMRLTGATKSHLTHWTREDILRADVAAAGGPGKHRRMSFFNLLEAAVALEMNRLGSTVQVMTAGVGYLRWLEGVAWKDPDTATSTYFREEAPGLAALIRERGRVAASRDETTKAESERFFHAADWAYRRLVRDACAWAVFRSAHTRRAIRWLGLAYSFETLDVENLAKFLGPLPEELTQSGGYLRVGLVVVPRHGTLPPESLGRAAVTIALSGLLERLETSAGDSLDHPQSSARSA